MSTQIKGKLLWLEREWQKSTHTWWSDKVSGTREKVSKKLKTQNLSRTSFLRQYNSTPCCTPLIRYKHVLYLLTMGDTCALLTMMYSTYNTRLTMRDTYTTNNATLLSIQHSRYLLTVLYSPLYLYIYIKTYSHLRYLQYAWSSHLCSVVHFQPFLLESLPNF